MLKSVLKTLGLGGGWWGHCPPLCDLRWFYFIDSNSTTIGFNCGCLPLPSIFVQILWYRKGILPRILTMTATMSLKRHGQHWQWGEVNVDKRLTWNWPNEWSQPVCLRPYLGRFSFWGRLYFWFHLHYWGRLLKSSTFRQRACLHTWLCGFVRE